MRSRRDGSKHRSEEGSVRRKRVPVQQKPASSGADCRAVFLVGFMGAGKTSVGRELADRLNWTFEDLDDRIVAREGRSIGEIFRVSGEAAFRQIEHLALVQALKELEAGMVRVIALGGGAFVQRKNAAVLRAAGMPTVFLDAQLKDLWQRCHQQAAASGLERPLLQSMAQFQKLYKSRRTSYLQASVKIGTSGRTVDEVATAIIENLGLRTLAIRHQQGEVE